MSTKPKKTQNKRLSFAVPAPPPPSPAPEPVVVREKEITTAELYAASWKLQEMGIKEQEDIRIIMRGCSFLWDDATASVIMRHAYRDRVWYPLAGIAIYLAVVWVCFGGIIKLLLNPQQGFATAFQVYGDWLAFLMLIGAAASLMIAVVLIMVWLAMLTYLIFYGSKLVMEVVFQVRRDMQRLRGVSEDDL